MTSPFPESEPAPQRLVSLGHNVYAAVPGPFADEYEARKKRFDFLFPQQLNPRGPSYHLHRPDLLELRWSVVERLTNRTVAYGLTAEQAVDAAMAATRYGQAPDVSWKPGELFYHANEGAA